MTAATNMTAALRWLQDHDPGDGHGQIGHTGSDQLFTRAVVLAAFEAGQGAASVEDEVLHHSDDDLLPYLPESVRGEKRCGIQRSVWMESWFVPWSPRNDNQNAEGPWSHWVVLARAILAADEKARAALKDARP